MGKLFSKQHTRPISGVPGGLISADGARVYRPPTVKPNTPAQYNPTGVQANFQTLQDGKVIGNGHLSVTN
jgi:filamentous hemagglutinin